MHEKFKAEKCKIKNQQLFETHKMTNLLSYIGFVMFTRQRNLGFTLNFIQFSPNFTNSKIDSKQTKNLLF